MHLELPFGSAELTYCTNIHAGETWADIKRSLDDHVPRIKDLVSPREPLGLGLRLSGIAARELVQPSTLGRFKEQLETLGAYVFTLNAFPYGPFHQTRVKDQVYQPDWRSEERLAFTNDAAAIMAALLPEGGSGSVSTVPGTFKPLAREAGALDQITDNLIRAAAALVEIEATTGRTVALALEPEPCCFLETVEETLAFFETHLLTRAAVTRFQALTGLSAADAEAGLRRHLGVCYDVCHGAVEFEDPQAALRMLRGAGIGVPKVQLSAALRVPEMHRDLIAELDRFNTGVYLHQVVVRGAGIARFSDLPQAFEAFEAGGARGEWRIHCHVPVFLKELDTLATTQDVLVSTLAALREDGFTRHLEVETYTWDVLPDRLKTRSKADDIAREITFCREELLNERHLFSSAGSRRDAAAAGAGL
jgi:sugar phosphate isomerase/epimerase